MQQSIASLSDPDRPGTVLFLSGLGLPLPIPFGVAPGADLRGLWTAITPPPPYGGDATTSGGLVPFGKACSGFHAVSRGEVQRTPAATVSSPLNNTS